MSESTTDAMTNEKIPLADRFLGVGIASVYVSWLLATARNLGFSRDEGFYFRAALNYSTWFRTLFTHPSRAFERAAVDSAWAANHEHPSLMKSLFSISWIYLHEQWKLVQDSSTAFRLPGMLMAGVAIYVTYLFAYRVFGRRAAVVAAVLLGLSPNVFYNAHLACFDVPVMAMWIVVIYAYYRAETATSAARIVWCGVAYGLALETKHNAWLMPAVLVPHAFILHGQEIFSGLKRGKLPIPASLVAMLLIGPCVFYALWPWIWNDTLPRLQEYVNFHVHHEYYNIEFLGTNYFGPPSPRMYAPVMIAATVPTVTLVLFFTGAGNRLISLFRRARAKTFDGGLPGEADVLLFLGFFVPLSVFLLLPSTPIFGGTKHWFPAYPFLAMFAGRGFDLALGAFERAIASRVDDKRMPLARGVFAFLVVAAPLAITRHSHPFGLSTYVPFVGGTQGGASLGLNRQFWGFTTQSLSGYFAANAPAGATVFFHDTAWDSWSELISEKRLRPDLRGVGSPSEADFSIVHHELHMAEVDYNIWVDYGHATPDFVLTHDGVPIISVYKRRR